MPDRGVFDDDPPCIFGSAMALEEHATRYADLADEFDWYDLPDKASEYRATARRLRSLAARCREVVESGGLVPSNPF